MSKAIEPKILPGFMELLPEEQIPFNNIMNIIKKNYELFGFSPLDTPAIELSEILLAKAGGETEKQIYRFNKGDNDLCLRFDLTVPLSRFVAMNQNELTFPFKRYQIGKVYRGERPQRGRFREFYQCDIDIIGNEILDLMYDAEIPSVIYKTFNDLGIEDFTICINNRKLLKGFFESLNVQDKSVDILRTVDKIAKITEEELIQELLDFGIEKSIVMQIISFVKIKENNQNIIKKLEDLNISNENFKIGLAELNSVLNGIKNLGVPDKNFKIDLTIARGLDYYTGTIYETILTNYPEIGSICSGGRYDDLASYYTDKKLPGVGVSIGLTRLFDQLNSRNFIQKNQKTIADILVIYMSENEKDYAFNFASSLRQNNIKTEIFMENVKFKNKLNYANKININFIAIIGEDEKNTNIITIKNMYSGEQFKLSINEVIAFLNTNINALEPIILK